MKYFAKKKGEKGERNEIYNMTDRTIQIGRLKEGINEQIIEQTRTTMPQAER